MNRALLSELVEKMSEGSVRQAAIQTGLTEQTIRDLLRKEANPTLKTIQKIADCYGVPVAELIEEK